MLLNKTSCLCGKNLKDTRFNRYEPNFDKSFYGGRVDMYGYYKCDCGRELKGYFSRNVDQSLTLFDLEVIKDIVKEEKMDLEATSLAYTEESAPYIAKTYEEMTWDEIKSIAKEKGLKTNCGREKLIQKLREN